MPIRTMLVRAVLTAMVVIGGAAVAHGAHMMPISGTCPTCVIG